MKHNYQSDKTEPLQETLSLQEECIENKKTVANSCLDIFANS